MHPDDKDFANKLACVYALIVGIAVFVICLIKFS